MPTTRPPQPLQRTSPLTAPFIPALQCRFGADLSPTNCTLLSAGLGDARHSRGAAECNLPASTEGRLGSVRLSLSTDGGAHTHS